MDDKRVKWFMDARFGMFIHWGLYAIAARGEWVRSTEGISIEDYQKYFDRFDPVDYNPRVWAKAARDAGMKYAVMTTKHHDGFCLFDSRLTEYKATNTLAGRDLIREYVDAFREAGIPIGFYYSLLDWHHPDYPAFCDRHHPMRKNEAFKNKRHIFSRYLEYMHGQVRELLTNYGNIDIMWFDFSYDDMSGEKWGANELIGMVRSLQPHIVIDNRLGGNIKAAVPEPYAGDFASPEQIIPPEMVTNEEGMPIPWESCITLNNDWGYSHNKDYKTARQIIRTLVQCTSKNGNLILNIGPDAKGNIPEKSLVVLDEVGRWMRLNGESIYGCGASDLPKPEWGYYTRKGNTLYAHIFEDVIGPVNLGGLNGRVKSARLVSDCSEIRLIRPWNTEDYPDDIFINFGTPDHHSFAKPDDKDTVVALELLA